MSPFLAYLRRAGSLHQTGKVKFVNISSLNLIHDFRVTRNSDDKIDPDQLYNSLKTILTSCRNHQNSWPFLNPVDRKAVPDYYDHIKFPMDLKTMTERLKANYYVNKRLFIADMKRYNLVIRVFYVC